MDFLTKGLSAVQFYIAFITMVITMIRPAFAPLLTLMMLSSQVHATLLDCSTKYIPVNTNVDIDYKNYYWENASEACIEVYEGASSSGTPILTDQWVFTGTTSDGSRSSSYSKKDSRKYCASGPFNGNPVTKGKLRFTKDVTIYSSDTIYVYVYAIGFTGTGDRFPIVLQKDGAKWDVPTSINLGEIGPGETSASINIPGASGGEATLTQISKTMPAGSTLLFNGLEAPVETVVESNGVSISMMTAPDAEAGEVNVSYTASLTCP